MNEDLEVLSWYRKIMQNPPYVEKEWTMKDWGLFFKIKNPKDKKVLAFVKLLLNNGVLEQNGSFEKGGKEYMSYGFSPDYRAKTLNLIESTDIYNMLYSLFDIDLSEKKGTLVK